MSEIKLTEQDLAPFTDLGTGLETSDAGYRLSRNGKFISIEPLGTGYIMQAPDGYVREFSSASLLLADPIFADLSRIARNQAILLSRHKMTRRPVPISTTMIGVQGNIPAFATTTTPWHALDQWLRDLKASQDNNTTDLLLIDGPAGVGKTTVVQETSLLRAENYDGSAALIFQIASRGRVLQNISDLIAFALQDVRSNLTIGQLRTLMRHGLVQLAIDGFDELSDPSGFETAWSGLNNLIASARGEAAFLLAGRETFLSTETILRQLTSVARTDRMAALSLGDPTPDQARGWLLEQEGWSSTLLKKEFVDPIFDSGSYALRPFFLDVVAKEPIALASDSPPAPDLLSYLADVMIEREAQKFVERLDPPEGNLAGNVYASYVARFLEEVARDMSENQSEAIADDALDLLATVAADGILPDDQVPAVVQRARTVVFLENDLRPGHVRFAHEQLLMHFLAREALRSVGDGETPRYIRRNPFGRDDIEVFGNVARGRQEQATRFLRQVRILLAKTSRDRTNSNLAVLGVAAACATAPDDAEIEIQGLGIGEMFFPFAAPKGIAIRDTAISILHASSSDLREVQFRDGVTISTLEIDRKSRLPASIPRPQMLVHPGGATVHPRDIEALLAPRDMAEGENVLSWPPELAELLGRIDRYRGFWLRTDEDNTDPQGRRIVTHSEWQEVFSALRELDLVTVKSRQASGAASEFVHFKQDVPLVQSGALYKALLS
ncbi:hypothetical protein ACRDNQ_14315 [Palleronia sp. KMU-117]|uniref:hypothetical protein n=1 Tax=Palleronia sp. KMU-117 TaxID=3434108 RepID=UPI003D75F3C8